MKQQLRGGFCFCCAAIAFLILLSSVNDTLARAGKDGPKLGSKPPPLKLRQILQGPKLEEVSWEKFSGKVVVLEFWNTRCGPCIAAIPHLNELVRHFAGKPVVFLSITDDNPDRATDFLKEKPMHGWVAVDGPITATRTAFDVRGIPHLVLVDQSGTIVAFTHPAKLQPEHIEEVLAGKQSSLPPPEPYDEEMSDDVVEVIQSKEKILSLSITGPFPMPDGAYNSRGWTTPHSEFQATKAYLQDAISAFFKIEQNQLDHADLLPTGLYDIAVAVPTNNVDRIERCFMSAFESAFNVILKPSQEVRPVYAMRFCSTNAPNLQIALKHGGGGGHDGGFILKGSKMDNIAAFLSEYVDRSIINETGSTNLWAAEMNWKLSEAEKLVPRLYKQLDDPAIKAVFGELADQPLSPELLQNIRQQLTPEDFELLSLELSKPKKQRFAVEPAVIIKAAREQLGLELIPTNQMVKVVKVLRVSE